MPKQLEKLRKEYVALKQRAMLYAGDMTKYGTERKSLNELVGECAHEITRRINVLRKDGAKGESLEDYAQDGEIRGILSAVEDARRSAARAHAALSERAGDGPGLLTELDAFHERLEDEIGTRETKKGKQIIQVGMASLPELKKLSADVRRFIDAEFRFTIVTPRALNLADWDKWLADAVREAEDVRVEQDQKDFAKRARDVKVVKLNLVAAGEARDKVVERCIASLKARKSGKTDAADAAVKEAAAALGELAALAKLYKRSEKQLSDFNVENMRGDKDGRIVLAAFVEIARLHAEAEQKYKATARMSV